MSARIGSRNFTVLSFLKKVSKYLGESLIESVVPLEPLRTVPVFVEKLSVGPGLVVSVFVHRFRFPSDRIITDPWLHISSWISPKYLMSCSAGVSSGHRDTSNSTSLIGIW